jgi:hypothetical protein
MQKEQKILHLVGRECVRERNTLRYLHPLVIFENIKTMDNEADDVEFKRTVRGDAEESLLRDSNRMPLADAFANVRHFPIEHDQSWRECPPSAPRPNS